MARAWAPCVRRERCEGVPGGAVVENPASAGGGSWVQSWGSWVQARAGGLHMRVSSNEKRSATRESPRAASKTQHSHKKRKAVLFTRTTSLGLSWAKS